MPRIRITPVSAGSLTIVEVPEGGASGVLSEAYLNATDAVIPAHSLVRVTSGGGLALVDASDKTTASASGFLVNTTNPGEAGRILTAGASNYLREPGSPIPANNAMLYASHVTPGTATCVAPQTEGGSLVQLGRVANGKVLVNLRLEVELY